MLHHLKVNNSIIFRIFRIFNIFNIFHIYHNRTDTLRLPIPTTCSSNLGRATPAAKASTLVQKSDPPGENRRMLDIGGGILFLSLLLIAILVPGDLAPIWFTDFRGTVPKLQYYYEWTQGILTIIGWGRILMSEVGDASIPDPASLWFIFYLGGCFAYGGIFTLMITCPLTFTLESSISPSYLFQGLYWGSISGYPYGDMILRSWVVIR